jgi:hypothetical protein
LLSHEAFERGCFHAADDPGKELTPVWRAVTKKKYQHQKEKERKKVKQ